MAPGVNTNHVRRPMNVRPIHASRRRCRRVSFHRCCHQNFSAPNTPEVAVAFVLPSASRRVRCRFFRRRHATPNPRAIRGCLCPDQPNHRVPSRRAHCPGHSFRGFPRPPFCTRVVASRCRRRRRARHLLETPRPRASRQSCAQRRVHANRRCTHTRHARTHSPNHSADTNPTMGHTLDTTSPRKLSGSTFRKPRTGRIQNNTTGHTTRRCRHESPNDVANARGHTHAPDRILSCSDNSNPNTSARAATHTRHHIPHPRRFALAPLGHPEPNTQARAASHRASNRAAYNSPKQQARAQRATQHTIEDSS
jgi:hypothetical protein